MNAKILNLSRSNLYSILLGIFLFFLSIGYNLAAYSFFSILLFYLIDPHLMHKIKGVPIQFYLPYFLYVSILTLGLLYTENLPKGFEEIRVRLISVIFPFIILTEKISTQNIYKIFNWFKYWLIVFSIILIIHKIVKYNNYIWDLSGLSLSDLTDIHQMFFSQFYLFILFFIFYQFHFKLIKLNIALLEILYFIFFIIVLGSGIIVMSMLFFSLVFFIFVIQKRYIKYSLILLLVVGFMAIKDTKLIKNRIYKITHIEWNIHKNIAKHQIKDLTEFNTFNTLEFRLLKWYVSVEIIKDNFWTGIGTGDYQDALNQGYEKIDFKTGMRSKFNSHNQFLEDFLKTGIFGFLAIFLIFITHAYIALKQKNYLLLSFVIVTMATALIESIFDRFHGVTLYAFFIPLIYVFFDLKNSKSDAKLAL